MLHKNKPELEYHVISNLSLIARSHLAQIRCGILPLAIETGRYTNIQPESRVCVMCNESDVETEYNFFICVSKV